MCETLDVFVSTTVTARDGVWPLAALHGCSKAARERPLLPFTISVSSDIAS